VTRAQAINSGLTAKQIERLVTRGQWSRVYPAVDRVSTSPLVWPAPLWAAQLWAGKNAVISHHSAAALWGLSDFSREAVELSGTKSLTPPPGIDFHHVRGLPKADLARTKGLAITTIERTLLDLIGAVTPEGFTERLFERALDEAINHQRTKPELLRGCLKRNRKRGRENLKLFSDLVAIREKYGATKSPLESDFAHFIRVSGFPEPMRSFFVTNRHAFIAEVDFAWAERKLCVQVHSASFHTQRKTWETDQLVENQLQAEGWRVLKVTHRMIENDAPALLSLVRAELDRRRAA
jgi:hypothetical protein